MPTFTRIFVSTMIFTYTNSKGRSVSKLGSISVELYIHRIQNILTYINYNVKIFLFFMRRLIIICNDSLIQMLISRSNS